MTAIIRKIPSITCMQYSSSAASVLSTLLLCDHLAKVNTPLVYQARSHQHTDQGRDPSDKAKPDSEQSRVMSKPRISDAVKKSKAETLWGLFVADAIAMPVHWFYNPDDIVTEYGNWLTGYIAPNQKHPSSILRLSAVDGSGRGSTSSSNSLIGSVILHDKLKYWNGSSSNNHYHQGMQAGDNTLNCVMVLHEIQTMNRVDRELTQPERDVREAVLTDYVSFMTTPASHNDTYAESFHRSFFKDWVAAG